MIRFFRIFIPVSTFTLLLAEILLTSGCFIAGTYLVFDVDPTGYLLYDGGMLAICVVTAVFLLGLYFSSLYSDVYVKSKVILLYQLFLVMGLAFLFEGLISAVASQLRLPIRVMMAGSSLSVGVIFVWRLFFSRYAMAILGHARVLLVGTDPVVEAVGRYIGTHPESGFQVVGYVEEEGLLNESLAGVQKFGHTGDLREIIHTIQPNRIVVGTRHGATAEFAHVLEDLRYSGQNIEEAAETYENMCGRVWVRGIRPSKLIYTSGFCAPKGNLLVRGVFDSLIALVALIVFSPVVGLTWLVLKRHTPGPVLLRQVRVGLNGALFTRYRFRLDEPRLDAPRENSIVAAIRKFHLDGTPQLLNVLRSEMAIVGPRPECPEFVEALSEIIPYYPERNCVRPGITGWAQIQERLAVEDTLATLEYDLHYIKNMSVSLDVLVIFQALRSMFVEEQEVAGAATRSA